MIHSPPGDQKIMDLSCLLKISGIVVYGGVCYRADKLIGKFHWTQFSYGISAVSIILPVLSLPNLYFVCPTFYSCTECGLEGIKCRVGRCCIRALNSTK